MESRVLHVYDLDDTLVHTPSWAEFTDTEKGGIINTALVFPDYFKKIKSLFWDCLAKEVVFMRLGDFVIPINTDTNKPFDVELLSYLTKEDKNKRLFEKKDGIIAVAPFPGFHSNPDTIGNLVNELLKDGYASANNKMILTGRNTKLTAIILQRISELGITQPNYGLYLFPSGSQKIVDWKTDVILNSIKDNNWTVVHLYEDRKDWIDTIAAKVEMIYPNVQFVGHFITNIKKGRSLT